MAEGAPTKLTCRLLVSMGLGFSIRGVVSRRRSKDPLARMEAWFDRHAADELLHAQMGTSEERPALFLGLHPSAEDVEIVDEGSGTILVSAKTSTTGPGYHAYLCELMDALGDACGVSWQPPDDEAFDETGYFHARDMGALENEFLSWLGGLAERLLEGASEGETGFIVSMGMAVRFDCDAFLTTPLGPRSIEWARGVAKSPRLGLDVFPWWDSARGARYALGRALSHMWVDVPWRSPVDDSERDLLARIDALLATARREEPGLELPLTEWAEIRRDLGLASDGKLPAASSGRVGYRRREVWNALTGGWSLRAPGAFVGSFEEDGTWSAFDGRLTLLFSSFGVKDRHGQPKSARDVLPARKGKGDPVELALAPSSHRAFVWSEDDGDGPYRVLQTEVAATGSLGVLTVSFRDPGDLEAAVRIANTLEHASD
jgi:hypothetical protein